MLRGLIIQMIPPHKGVDALVLHKLYQRHFTTHSRPTTPIIASNVAATVCCIYNVHNSICYMQSMKTFAMGTQD